MVVENGKIPKIYFDTTFIIDLSVGKNLPCSIMEDIKKNDWKYYVPHFGIMESLDIKQEHFFFIKKIGLGEPIKQILNKRRERDLSDKELYDIQEKFVNTLLKPQKMDWGIFFETAGWHLCLKITRETNINSSDVIHLVTALAQECDILLTSDTHFVREANRYLKENYKNKLRLCEPENFYDLLTERGFL